jgi:chromosome segregation ATPase
MAPPNGESKERAARVDERFDETNRRITEGREETNRRFDEAKEVTNRRFDEANLRFNRVESDIGELKKSVTKIQESVVAMHATLTRIGFGVALTLVSVLLTRGF